MGISAIILMLTLVQQGGQPPVEYRNPDLDLAFTHPKSWVFATKKGVTKVALPLANSSEIGDLEIYSVTFNSDKAEWQQVQATFIATMKHDLVRQWEEEILGVPMLMTRSTYQDSKGKDIASLTALIYSRTPRKMLIRLTTPADSYDTAEFDLRNALQSLHTIDGSMPEPEDPNRKITPEDLKPKPVEAPPKVYYLDVPKGQQKLVKGAGSVETQAGGKRVALHFDSDWSAEPDGKGGFVLKNSEITGSLSVTVNSMLDSESPTVALYKCGSVALGNYLKVSERTETNAIVNRAGAKVSTVWRVGSSDKGPIASCEAFGLLTDYYWLATWHYDGNLPPSERKAINALFLGMSVEPRP